MNFHVTKDDCCVDNVKFLISVARRAPGLKILPEGEQYTPEIDPIELSSKKSLRVTDGTNTINTITAFWIGQILADSNCILRMSTGTKKDLQTIRNRTKIFVAPTNSIDKMLLAGALRRRDEIKIAEARKRFDEHVNTIGVLPECYILSFKQMHLSNGHFCDLLPHYKRFLAQNAQLVALDLDVSYNMDTVDCYGKNNDIFDNGFDDFVTANRSYRKLNLSNTYFGRGIQKAIKIGNLQMNTLILSKMQCGYSILQAVASAFKKAPECTRVSLSHLDVSYNSEWFGERSWKMVSEGVFCGLKKLELQPLLYNPYCNPDQGRFLIRQIRNGCFPHIQEVIVDDFNSFRFSPRAPGEFYGFPCSLHDFQMNINWAIKEKEI